ncbi:DNA-binding response regulator, partial [Streptococcus suis]
VESTLDLLKEWPQAQIVILTYYLNYEKIYPVLEAGARGYMLKTSSAVEILAAIREVARGECASESVVERKVEHQKRLA